MKPLWSVEKIRDWGAVGCGRYIHLARRVSKQVFELEFWKNEYATWFNAI